MNLIDDFAWYAGRRVLVTGHTGFKGSWLCRALQLAGADVLGYALEPPTEPSLYGLAAIGDGMRSVTADVRDYDALSRTFAEFRPEVVLHLAAQPIVRESYRDPRGTYETNVMGTINMLECVRRCDSVRSVLNVTTDKVYLNREWEWGYREDEPLDGHDPYSNSKSCSELVTHSYARSFLTDAGVAVSTARAGNVIGGGDFAAERIVPDCVRAAASGETLVLRNPESTRPYQHVLEPVMAYLMIAARQAQDPSLAGWYNVGPGDAGCVMTGELVRMFSEAWESETGTSLIWEAREDPDAPHEASFLKLDSSRIRRTFDWSPTWGIHEAIRRSAAWYALWARGGLTIRLRDEVDSQISDAFSR